MPPRRGLGAALQRRWWQPPDAAALAPRLLQPLASLYGWWSAARRRRQPPATALPVPVVVVGNVVVGGAGKTPTVIAVVALLRERGWRPGVVSRGYGRRGRAVRGVGRDDDPADTGDEPLLIARRTGAPVYVGADRVAAVRALCRAHPAVDVVVSDDGLQHAALARVVEVVVFDDRGGGNGRLLPAGPLREPLAAAAPARAGAPVPPRLVLYTGSRVSTGLAGALAGTSVASAWPLAAWWRGDATAALPLAAWRGRRVRALAGIGAPAKFFAALRAHGLDVDGQPLPDHHDHRRLRWTDLDSDVLTTEKDAVKFAPEAPGRPPLWVVPLDLVLPDAFVAALLGALSQAGIDAPRAAAVP